MVDLLVILTEIDIHVLSLIRAITLISQINMIRDDIFAIEVLFFIKIDHIGVKSVIDSTEVLHFCQGWPLVVIIYVRLARLLQLNH